MMLGRCYYLLQYSYTAMLTSRLVEYIFFFGLLGLVAYLVWRLIAPFAGTLALAAIIVTICYPIYTHVVAYTPRRNKTVASLISVFLVVIIVVIPLVILGSLIFKEALSVYSLFSSGTQLSIERQITDFEQAVRTVLPGFSIEVTAYIQQFANFIAENIGSIFAGTASTIFLFFIALIASFYFFRDGKEFTKYLVQLSPLPDDQDEKIIQRLANAIRSVALGTVLVALIQGIVTAIGLWLFGFERAVLWGSIAAFGALIPGVGTSIIFIPAVAYLLATGAYLYAGGVALWGLFAVGLIDNLLGPYLMSRGNNLHPFLILLSVIGGIALLGPVGFIIGPVVMSLFAVLLELYSLHVRREE